MNPVYQYHLGIVYLASRNFDLGARALRTALREASDFPYAQSAKSELTKIAGNQSK